MATLLVGIAIVRIRYKEKVEDFYIAHLWKGRTRDVYKQNYFWYTCTMTCSWKKQSKQLLFSSKVLHLVPTQIIVFINGKSTYTASFIFYK